MSNNYIPECFIHTPIVLLDLLYPTLLPREEKPHGKFPLRNSQRNAGGKLRKAPRRGRASVWKRRNRKDEFDEQRRTDGASSLKWWTLRKLPALPSPRRITQWRIASGIATIEEHAAHYARPRLPAYDRVRSMDHVDPTDGFRGNLRHRQFRESSVHRTPVILRRRVSLSPGLPVENRSIAKPDPSSFSFLFFPFPPFFSVTQTFTRFLFFPRIIRGMVFKGIAKESEKCDVNQGVA